MKIALINLLLLITLGSPAQDALHTYRFALKDKKLSVSKLRADSTISVLRRRLLNEGYNNFSDYNDAMISYDNLKKEFVVKCKDAVEEEFLNNWWLKPCKTFIYESYDASVLNEILFSGSNSEKEEAAKKRFIVLLNTGTGNSIGSDMGYKKAEIGIVKRSDTAEFNKISRELHGYLPKDCVFAFLEEISVFKDSASTFKVYALRNNQWAMPLNTLISSAKPRFDQRARPEVEIVFNAIGKKRFAEITRKNINLALLFVIDGSVYSAPFVMSQVEFGKAVISGNFIVGDTKELANSLSAGNLPLQLILIR